MEKNVVFIGGARGLGKSALVHQIKAKAPDRIQVINCTEALMAEIGAERRESLHELTFEEKKAALNRGVARILSQIGEEIELVLIDGHFAVEIEPGEFELDCFPEVIRERLHTAYNLVADPESIRNVRKKDPKRRTISLDSIREELRLNEQEVDRLREELQITIINMGIDLTSNGEKWDFTPMLEELEEVETEIKEAPELTGQESKITLGGPYFEAIKEGIKKIEGRIATDKYGNLKRGDVVIFVNKNSGEEIRTVVIRTAKYEDFDKLVDNEDVSKLIPGEDKESAKIIYKGLYQGNDEELIRQHGVIAIELKLLN